MTSLTCGARLAGNGVLIRDVTQPSFWDDSAYNPPDHPVVGVSWYEAVAFANWLAQETGLSIRLPTEAEWEKAARGSDGRLWPWGNQPPDGSRLNYCDTNCEYDWKNENVDDGYAYTAPVGSYLDGASPYGALDMAGNVWEWTGSLYEEYPYNAADGREELNVGGYRVLRGGAFDDSRYAVRCAFRFANFPVDRSLNLGLRVMSPGL